MCHCPSLGLLFCCTNVLRIKFKYCNLFWGPKIQECDGGAHVCRGGHRGVANTMGERLQSQSSY